MIKFLRKNIFLKCFCLLLALGLWLYVMNEQNPSITNSVSVQLSIINSPDGYEIHHDTDTIKLKVKAPRATFASVDSSDFKAYVDLSNIKEGDQDIPVHIQLPAGFEMAAFSPETIKFTVEKIIQKQIPVDLVLSGKPAAGMVVANIKQSADTIVVKGPRSQVNKVRKAIGYIGLDNNKDDFSVIVPLRPIDADGKEVSGVTVLASTVNANVTLANGLTHKIVTIKPAAADNLSAGYDLESLKVTPDKVEITGDPQTISTINSIDTDKLSLSGLTSSTEQTVSLMIPDGVTASIDKVNIKITISSKKSDKN